MGTATMTLAEYRAEQAERGVSAHDRSRRLTEGNERLNTHVWTDEQLQGIPEDLAQFAFEQGASLQEEFGSLSGLMADRRAVGQGKVRIAGVRK